VQVAGAGERFIQDRTQAGLGQCGCCTLVLLSLLRPGFELVIHRLWDAAGSPHCAQHAFQVCGPGFATVQEGS
jgi:hypothetical protein